MSETGSHHTDEDGEKVEAVPRPEMILKKRRNKKGNEEYLVKWEDCGDEDNSWVTYDTVTKYPDLMKDFRYPYINQGKRELVAREEGRKKREEEARGGQQGQSQDKTTLPHVSGRSGSVPGGKGREAAGSSKKKKSKTSMESCSTSTPSTVTTLAEKCLQNSVILDNLFKECPHDLLANCRLVCQTWYRESLLTWRSTSSIIVLHRLRTKDEIYLAKTKDLNRVNEMFDYRPTEEVEEDADTEFDAPSKTSLSLSTFLTHLEQDCQTKPYRQFHLSNWRFTLPPTNRKSSRCGIKSIQGQQDRFWELVGGNVTYLKLSECRFEDASTFRKIIFQTCPNLETLILHNWRPLEPLDDNDDDYTPPKPTMTPYQTPAYGEQKNLKALYVSHDDQEVLPISHLEILSHFPSLTTLNLSYGDDQLLLDYDNEYPDPADLIMWIDAIKVIRRHDGDKLALRNFSVAPGFELLNSTDPAKCRELCSLFQEMNLHVEFLGLRLHSDVVGLLKDVLTLSGKTIRKIRALKWGENGGFRRRPIPPTSTQFPCKFPFGLELDNLAELTISPIFCGDMEFMKWTPNLEKLRIVKNSIEWGLHGASAEDPEQMSLNSSEAIMGDVKLLKLKELWMGYRLYDVEEARRFCGWMPNLEVATLFLDDEQFGVICENWKSLKHIHVLGSRLGDKGITGMGFKGEGGRSGKGVVKPRPNITLLKELTCFQFAMMHSSLLLSDASMHNGFLKLPNLQTLGIASYKSTIGDGAIKAIHEKVPNCQIIGNPEVYGPSRGGGGRAQLRIEDRNIKCRYFPIINYTC